ncbi:MAG: tetratricopeptide repeat protein [Aquimonas sp.]|nr:tetratricopeptide repeat protein [Aquimonas sp.]
MFLILVASLTLVAIAFVLLPLLRPPVDDPAADKRRALRQAHATGALDEAELRERLQALPPEPRQPARAGLPLLAALAVILPAASVLTYLSVGSPQALDPASRVAAPPSPETMDAAIAALEQRLQANPTDLDGWILLARSKRSLERFEEAAAAFDRAYRLDPDNVDLMVGQAEAQVLASADRRWGGEPLALLQRALERDPSHGQGRWLAGVAAIQSGRADEAARIWEGLLAEMPPEAEALNALRNQVNQARQMAGLDPLPATATAAPLPISAAPSAVSPATDAAGPRLEVEVSLDPALAAQVPPGAVLFVFARAVEGPRAPLAIQRLAADALPATVVLDASMGMVAGMDLSSQTQVTVGARISASGNAAPQAGDLEGLASPVAVDSGRTRVQINRVLP